MCRTGRGIDFLKYLDIGTDFPLCFGSFDSAKIGGNRVWKCQFYLWTWRAWKLKLVGKGGSLEWQESLKKGVIKVSTVVVPLPRGLQTSEQGSGSKHIFMCLKYQFLQLDGFKILNNKSNRWCLLNMLSLKYLVSMNNSVRYSKSKTNTIALSFSCTFYIIK